MVGTLRTSVAAVVTVAALLCAVDAPAQESGRSLKIGVVDLQKALTTSKEGKETKTKLEAAVNDAQQKLDDMSKKVQKLQDDLEKQRLTLKDDVLAEKQREIENAKKEAVRYRSDVLDELKNKEGEATQRILKALADVVQKIGREDGYSLVLETHNMLYADSAYDLTDKLIQRFDAEGMPKALEGEGEGKGSKGKSSKP
jgi:outer membrane protein